MPRNDDIDDLPSLMPDSDEIKASKNKSPKSADSASADTAKERPSSRATTAGRESGRSIQPPGTNNLRAAQAAASNSPMLWVLVLATLLSLLGGGYWAYNKLTDVDLLLTVSRGELDHARKRIGELEALVVATDVNSNKSGTVVQAQVRLMDTRMKDRNKFVDSEIDKLWGVSYRTNRPSIEENQKAIENNTTATKQQAETLETQKQSIAKQQTMLEEAAKSSQFAVSAVEAQVADIAKLEATLTQVLETADSQSAALAAQKKTIDDQNQVLAEQKAAFEDQQRALVNQELEIATQKEQLINQEQSLAQQQKLLLAQQQITANQEQLAKELAQQRLEDLAKLNNDIADVSASLASASDTTPEVEALTRRMSTLESRLRILTAIEQNASQMDERVYETEQRLDAVDAFRRETNRQIDQINGQVRTLSFN